MDYYLDAVATGREAYYTGAVAEGEPPGRWYGSGAAALGLSGLVDAQDMRGLYAHFVDPRDERFADPEKWTEADTLGHTGRKYLSAEELYAAALNAEPDADAERRDELRLDAAKRARHNVAFHDITFSVPKSISVLHTAFEAKEVTARKAGDLDAAAAWGQHRTAVEDAVWAGNNAMLNYLQDKAGYSRIGHHGGADGRWIDAHDWTVASFFQHDSRDHDPHLHIHNTTLNRVQCADGVWRTLDSRGLRTWRPGAAAVGERTTGEHLTRSMSARLAMRPDGKAREVLGIARELIEAVSSRRREITPKTAELAAAYEAVNGRAPKGKALDRLYRQASDTTRPTKSHTGETQEEFLRRVDRESVAATGGDLATVAETVVALAGEPVAAQTWSETAVIETAVEAVQDRKTGWTEADLTREMNNALPDDLALPDGADVVTLLDGLTAKGLTLVNSLKATKPWAGSIPDSHRLANGKSSWEAPGGELYATPAHIHTERLLVEAAARGGAPALSTAAVDAFLAGLAADGIELGADQAAAVRGVLGSGACLESLVGPAGTGKSFVTGILAQAWTDPTLWDGQQRRVVGLATTEKATGVLEGEGLSARNISRWLAIQDRLSAGRPVGDDQAWRLGAGDLVMVDESSMVDTKALAAVHAHVTAAGAKWLLTGDHLQMTAIGAGGGMELIVGAGASYELAEARRFTHEWERDASLRLRAGDESVLTEYHKHGRLIDAGTIEAAEDSAGSAWLADTLTGHHALLTVNSNEQAARMSAKLRAEFVRLGLVDETGSVPVGLQGNYAGVNDLVQARRIGRHLVGYEGNRTGPINRAQYRVLATREDGGLVVVPVLGRGTGGEERHGEKMTLPGTYVAEHIELGYAATEYSIQGVTVGSTHNLTTPQTSRAAFYMAMTRGQHTNTAHVATQTVPDQDAPAGAVHDAVHRSPAAVLALAFERSEVDQSALTSIAESLAEANSVRTAVELMSGFGADATAGRTAGWLDQLVDTGHLTAAQRTRMAAEDGAATLDRVLRRAEIAGHDPRQVLHDAVTERSLGDARQITNVVHERITTNRALSLDPVGDSFTDWTPAVDNPDHQRLLTVLSATADNRARELGAQTVDEQPVWATDAFGPLPDDPDARRAWRERAGIVAAHRELTDHDDPTNAIGPPPKPGQLEAYASYRASWRALGRPEADADETHMRDGQLRIRIRAWEREQTWAPPRVVNELAGTTQAATRHRQTATLRAAEAHAAADPDTRDRLHQEAADAAALADLLDTQIEQLTEIDEAWALHRAHTAMTRVNADRATAELANRHAANPPTETPTTGEEWLAHQAAAMHTEDPHREIHDEHELADTTPPVANLPTHDHGAGLGMAAPDIRDIAAAEPPRVEDDAVRVPSADETADNLARAQRALAETRHRRADEQRHADEQARAQQLARWHTDDQTTHQQHTQDHLHDHAVPQLTPDDPHA